MFVYVMLSCLFLVALWSPAGKGLTSWRHVGVCCAVVFVPCSLVVTCWERAALLAVMFVVFCHFLKCILVHIRIKGEVGNVKQVKYFTDRSKLVLLLLIFYVFLSCVCCAYVRVCLYVPCGHLLGLG